MKTRVLCLGFAAALSTFAPGPVAAGQPDAPSPAATPGPRPYDILDLPAVASPLAPRSLVYSLTRVGSRLFATGIRGHILYSDDAGRSWTQADSVPVRSSLLDAGFATPEVGWVVGNEGVILHTTDGGRNWQLQLDGRRLPQIGLDYYRSRLEQEPDSERLALLVEEMQIAAEAPADRPFFKVIPQSPEVAIAAGAYGLLFRTTDGGSSWQPVMEQMDVEQYVHLFDYARLPAPAAPGGDAPAASMLDGLVAVGEMGTVLAVDPATGRWSPRPFPYEGSMFTLLDTGEALLTGGLRGLVFRSADRGESWQEVAKPETGAVVASVRLADGRVVLATQEGRLLASGDGGASFALLDAAELGAVSDILEGSPGELVVSGAFGIRTVALPAAGPATAP